jgi:CubicO group peptidase (beta-lactamase class C family)
VSTVDDYLAFARAILTGGLLGEDSVRAMTSDQLRPEQRAAGGLFLDGQSWGFGGSVDIDPVDPWNVPGRYGWVGGTGTAAYLTPSTGTVTILLMQLDVTTPTPTAVMRDFWRYAGG